MRNNINDFIPHRLRRGFRNGVPKWDFVIVLYRPLTPKGRKSRINKYYCHTEKFAHGSLSDTERVNIALTNGQTKKKPYLPKGYTWEPQLMRVD